MEGVTNNNPRPGGKGREGHALQIKIFSNKYTFIPLQKTFVAKKNSCKNIIVKVSSFIKTKQYLQLLGKRDLHQSMLS